VNIEARAALTPNTKISPIARSNNHLALPNPPREHDARGTCRRLSSDQPPGVKYIPQKTAISSVQLVLRPATRTQRAMTLRCSLGDGVGDIGSSWKALAYRPWPTKRTALVNGSTWRHGQAPGRILTRQQRILIPHRARQPRWDVADAARPLLPAGDTRVPPVAYIVIGGTGAAGQPVRCLTGVSDAASGDNSGRDRRACPAAQR